MKENNTSKRTNSQDTPTSTQSNQSKTYAKSLLQDHYSEATENEKKGQYTMSLGSSAIWDQPIQSKREAETLLDEMPIKLMLLMNCVYGKYMDEYLQSASKTAAREMKLGSE